MGLNTRLFNLVCYFLALNLKVIIARVRVFSWWCVQLCEKVEASVLTTFVHCWVCFLDFHRLLDLQPQLVFLSGTYYAELQLGASVL